MAASDEEFVALWEDESLSVADIAARLNVEYKAVTRRAAKMRSRGDALSRRERPTTRRNTEREERIVRLWNSGTSGGQIALELGVTRNSVIGLLHRARLRLGEAAVPRRSTPTRAAERESRTRLRPPPAPKPEPAPAEPPTEGVHLMDLLPHHCRCVIGPEHYCGRQRVPGSSWCADHRLRFVSRRARMPAIFRAWR